MNTWPTQPIPQADNVLFNKLDANGRPCTDGNVSQTNAYVPFATATAPDGKPFKIGCAYDPYDTTQYVVHAVRDDGLAGELVQPGEPDVHHLWRDRPRAVAFEQIPRASQVAAAFGGIGAARLGRATRRRPTPGNFSALECRDRQAGVAPALACPVLQRLDEHR